MTNDMLKTKSISVVSDSYREQCHALRRECREYAIDSMTISKNEYEVLRLRFGLTLPIIEGRAPILVDTTYFLRIKNTASFQR